MYISAIGRLFGRPATPAASDDGLRQAAALLALLALAQVFLWSSAFGLTYSSPEIDSAEQFIWAFSLENGYWKHPPLPSWIMHGLLQVFGASVVLPFAATQLCIVVALALTWRLACEFMSPNRALIATLLTSLVTYHNIGGDAFNHNTVLLPFQAAAVLCFHFAARRPGWWRWGLVGLFAGLAMLVKYVALLPLAGLLLYLLLDRRMHCRRTLIGLLIAGAVFALVLLPHVIWLGRTDFLPFRYARSVTHALPGAAAIVRSLADFLLMQFLRLLPFLIGAAIVLRSARRFHAARASTEPPAHAAVGPLAAPDRLFLWIITLSPLLMTVAYGLASRAELQTRWGANCFLTVGVLLMATSRSIDSKSVLQRTVQVVAVGQLVLCLGLTLGKTVLANHLGHRTRANFPGAVLAQMSQQTWRNHTDVPLRLVVSDIWLGGNLIANSSRRLAVLIDGKHFKSPWVNQEAIADCGALILDDVTPDKAGHAAPNPELEALLERADASGTWTLPWARPERAPVGSHRGSVRWGVIKPITSGQCTLR
ncbi:MAG: glycosyltransferase family 39 protein [Ideonella sp.]